MWDIVQLKNIKLYRPSSKMFWSLLISLLLSSFSQKASAQITADFTVSRSQGCPEPLVTQLQDASTSANPIQSYVWTVIGPNGVLPNSPFFATNPFIALSVPGLYTVSLTITDNLGNSSTLTQNDVIEVFEPPSVSLSANTEFLCFGDSITVNLSCNPGCGSIATSFFQPIPGVLIQNACDTSVTLPYTSSSVFSPNAILTNSCGCIIQDTASFAVTPIQRPNAQFSLPETDFCIVPASVSATNLSSSTSAGTNYTWNFIDSLGNVVSTQTGFEPLVTLNEGVYSLELIAETNGCTDTFFQNQVIRVFNAIIDFSISTDTLCALENVVFTDLSVPTPDLWSWTMPGASPSNASTPVVNGSYANAGSYDVTLTVGFPGGCSLTQIQTDAIEILDIPIPSATFTVNEDCKVPATLNVQSTSINTVQTEWTFPNGTPSSATGVGPVFVTYDGFGSYEVVLTETASNGCQVTETLNDFHVVQPYNTSIVPDVVDGCVPLNVNYTALFNNLPTGESIQSYAWNFPGAASVTSSSSPGPSVIYSDTGCFDVELITITTTGCTDTVLLEDAICAGSPPIGMGMTDTLEACLQTEQVCFFYNGINADTIFWDFGDGATTSASPFDTVCHNYNNGIGPSIPSFTALQYNCPNDINPTLLPAINVLGPFAEFTDSIGCDNENTVFFDASNSSDYSSVSWDFGDPSTTSDVSSNVIDSYTYPPVSVTTDFAVLLTLTNATTGCVQEVSRTVRIYPDTIIAGISDDSICAGEVISLFQNSPDATGIGGNTRWTFDGSSNFFNGLGNGPVPPRIRGTGQALTVLFAEAGIYPINMRYVNRNGCADTFSTSLYVAGASTGAVADNVSGCAPLTVNFSDTSTAPFSGIESYLWDFGLNNTISDTSNQAVTSFVYDTFGVFQVSLTLIDSAGCAINDNSIVINVSDPTIDLTLSDTFICQDACVTFTDNSTGTNVTNYSWNFDQGVPSTISGANESNVSACFPVEGNQTIQYQISDNNGCVADTTFELPVFDIVADYAISQTSLPCPFPVQVVQFTNLSQNNVDTNSLLWDFGNGFFSTEVNPEQIYVRAGSYPISLTVSSNTGCSDTLIRDTVTVGGPWANLRVLGNNSGCVCDSFDIEYSLYGTPSASFVLGDGTEIPLSVVGSLTDTITDTLFDVAFCNLGVFAPGVFVDDSNCSYTYFLPDSSIIIDSFDFDYSVNDSAFCGVGQVDLVSNTVSFPGNFPLTDIFWDFGDLSTTADTSSQAATNYNYPSPGYYELTLTATSSIGCTQSFTDSIYLPEAPSISLTGDTAGCLNGSGFDATFTYTSQADTLFGASIVQSIWDFGDGSPLTVANDSVQHIFINPGTFSVIVSLTDSRGCASSDSTFIEILADPVIGIPNDTTICRGDSIRLFATDIETVLWSPGYGIEDTLSLAPLVYPDTSTTYVVFGIDSNGCSSQLGGFVQVTVDRVIADFSVDQACAGSPVSFTDESSGGLGSIVQWNWDFGDPASGVNNTSALQNPQHSYAVDSIYLASLTIQNDNGCSFDTTANILVGQGPQASFTFNDTCQNEPASFDASATFGGTGNITDYIWIFNDPSNTQDTLTGANANYTFTGSGDYNVCLIVETDLNCASNQDTVCQSVHIRSLPSVDVVVDSVCLGTATSYNQLSSVAEAPFTSYTWNLGISPFDLLTIAAPNSPDTSRINPIAGIYLVSLSITDSLGCVGIARDTAVVYDLPEADFEVLATCTETASTVNDLSQPAALDQALLTWTWDFDEGSGDEVIIPPITTTFTQDGIHNIQLVVEDNVGCRDTAFQTIDLVPAPVAVITPSDTAACEGLTSVILGGLSQVSTLTATYSWDYDYNIQPGFDQVDAVNPGYTQIYPIGTYTILLEIVDENGCIDSAFQDIIVFENPEAVIEFGPACEDFPVDFTSVSLEGDAPISSANWIFDNVVGVNGFNAVHNSPNDITAELYIEDANGCVDRDSIQVIQDVLPQVVVDPLVDTICLGETAVFAVNGFDSIQYAFNPNLQVTFNEISSQLEVEPLLEGLSVFFFEGLSENDHCPRDTSPNLSVLVPVIPIASPLAEPDTILQGSSSLLSVEINGLYDTLIWDLSANSGVVDNETLLVNPSESTIYEFDIEYSVNSVTCTLDSFVLVGVENSCADGFIFLPNAFSPNGDLLHDNFYLQGSGLTNVNSFAVYDRWGVLLFESLNTLPNSEMNGWDGRSKNGERCNEGVYIFRYEVQCSNGDRVQGSGNVTLIR